MKKKWKTIITVSVILVVFIGVGTTMIIHSQKQDNQNNQSQKNQLQKIQQDFPIANYNDLLPTNSEERIKREKRNKARNTEFEQPDDAERFMLTEERNSFYGTFPSHSPVEPAIPAKQSNAIIVGDIVSATAYLSEDKVSIYSEFEVSNFDVFKNTSPESLSSEKPIVISRDGGGVRFPSGKVIFNFLLEKPMPLVGKKYLFFLEYSVQKGFSIITAYELKQGQVFPLDGVTPNGNVTRQFAGHQSFKGVSEVDFLNQVNEAIKKNSNIFRKEE